jgi:SAM-dependent methyltransferase
VLDESVLTRLAYASLSPLRTRIEVHQRYSEQPDDLEEAVAEAVGAAPTAVVLDVGCGTGSFLRRLAGSGAGRCLVGVDLSAAAVASLSGAVGVAAVVADAQRLPFDAERFDVVTARHMLYHVPDPVRAVREARRVLRPGGVFAAVVNVERTTPMLMNLVAESAAVHGLTRPDSLIKIHSGNLPAIVKRVFGNARVHRRDNALVFDSPEPVIAYAVSCLTFVGVTVDNPLHQQVAATVAAKARALFAEQPRWRDPKGYVIVTAVA